MGEEDLVRKRIEEIDRNMGLESIGSPLWVACLWAELDEADRIFSWLNKAYKTHDWWMIFLQVMPSLNDYRADPRYTTLLKKMRLDK